MRLKVSGLTRHPLAMALIVGGGTIYVAINSFGVEIAELVRLLLISTAVVLLLALPAALLVGAFKLLQRYRQRDEEGL